MFWGRAMWRELRWYRTLLGCTMNKCGSQMFQGESRSQPGASSEEMVRVSCKVTCCCERRRPSAAKAATFGGECGPAEAGPFRKQKGATGLYSEERLSKAWCESAGKVTCCCERRRPS